jgi:hypothetical protein
MFKQQITLNPVPKRPERWSSTVCTLLGERNPRRERFETSKNNRRQRWNTPKKHRRYHLDPHNLYRYHQGSQTEPEHPHLCPRPAVLLPLSLPPSFKSSGLLRHDE